MTFYSRDIPKLCKIIVKDQPTKPLWKLYQKLSSLPWCSIKFKSMTPFHKYPHHPDLEERGQPEELCGLETSDPDWQSWFSHFWWARIWRSTLVTRRWIAPWPSDKWQWKWENNLTRKRKSPKHGVSVVEGFSMEFRRLGPVKGSQCRALHISLEKMRWPPHILTTSYIDQAPAGSRDIPGSRDWPPIPIPGFLKIKSQDFIFKNPGIGI